MGAERRWKEFETREGAGTTAFLGKRGKEDSGIKGLPAGNKKKYQSKKG